MDTPLLFSIVIPVYNEESILEKEVEAILAEMIVFLPESSYELILVENGSFDRTRITAMDLEKRHSSVRVIYLPTAGYGSALKQGILASRGQYTVLFNIDFWDVQFIRKAYNRLQAKKLDMVVGSKTMIGSEDTRPLVRRAITRFFNSLLQRVFGFAGTDTHGIKLLARESIMPIIKACKTEREIFDTEFVLRAQTQALKTEEIPVVCQQKRKTTYNITKRIPRTIKDLFILFWELRVRTGRATKPLLFLTGGLFVSIVFFGNILYGFPDSPSPWFDQGVNLGIAKTFVQDGVYSLRLGTGEFVRERSMMISTNYPVLGWIIFAFSILGVGLAQAQLVMASLLTVFLVLSYIFNKEIYNNKIAGLASLGLIVTFLPFYGHGFSGGLGEIGGLVYLLGGLLIILKNRSKYLFFAGLLFGLAATTKVIFLSILFAVACAELYGAVKEKQIPWKRWGIMFTGMVVPLLFWVYTLVPNDQPWQYLSQTYEYYRNPYQTETKNYLTNFLKFFTESTPFHFALLFGTVLIARIRTWKNDQFIYQHVVLFVFVMVNLIWFLATPGWYRYFFSAHMIVLILFPAALLELTKFFSVRLIVRYGALTILLGLVLIQTIHLVRERPTRIYYNPEPRLTAIMLAKRLGENADILMIDQPELWFLFPGQNARQYLHMNPHISFGEDIFKTKHLPAYVVLIGEPTNNKYLAKHAFEFKDNYNFIEYYGRYSLFAKH